MNGVKYSALAVLLIGSCNLYADESKVILGFEIGSSSLELDRELAADFDSEQLDDGGVSATFLAGYRWKNNVQVEANLARSGTLFSFGLGDFYEADEAKLLVGYSFELTKHLRIVPSLGVSRWDVNLQESAFLNPGPEARAESDGTDFSYKVNVEFPIAKGFVLGVSYANTNTGVGTIDLTQASLKYEF